MVQPTVKQPFQRILAGDWRHGLKEPKQWIHIGPKSVVVAHRVTPRANPAAGYRLVPAWGETDVGRNRYYEHTSGVIPREAVTRRRRLACGPVTPFRPVTLLWVGN